MSKANSRSVGRQPFSPLRCLRILVAVATACLGFASAYGWGGEHNRITAAAVEVLPPDDRAAIAPEAAA
ncbi:MAG: hypothetical protein WA117_18395, partial [Verrucomicrobiia bacterium]